MTATPDRDAAGRWKRRRWWVGFALTGGVAAALAWGVDLPELWRRVADAPPACLPVLVASLLLQQFFGCLRFRHYLQDGSMSVGHAFAAENLSAFYAFFLPFGVGEAARAMVWKRQCGCSLSRLGAGYAMVRLLDVNVLLVQLLAMSLAVGPEGGVDLSLVRLVLALAVACFAAFWIAARSPLAARLETAGRRLTDRLAGRPFLARASLHALALFGQFKGLAAAPGRELARMWLWTFLFQGIQVVETWYLAVSVSPGRTWLEVFWVYLAWVAASFVPIQGLARTGSYDAGWIGGLMLAGVPYEVAVSVNLASHALYIVRTVAAQAVTGLQILVLSRRGVWR